MMRSNGGWACQDDGRLGGGPHVRPRIERPDVPGGSHTAPATTAAPATVVVTKPAGATTTSATSSATTRSHFGGTLVGPGTAAAPRLCRSQLRVASTPSHGWCGRSPMGW